MTVSRKVIIVELPASLHHPKNASWQLNFNVTRQDEHSKVIYSAPKVVLKHEHHKRQSPTSENRSRNVDKRGGASEHKAAELSVSERADIKYNALVRVRKGALHCKYQCVKDRRQCRRDCRDGVVRECKLTRKVYKSSSFHRALLCGNENARIMYPRPNYYNYCSGGCSSRVLSTTKSRYSWFAAQNNLPSSGCSPAKFRKVRILCSLNGHLFNRMVKDFFIESCACGVVPTK